MSHKNQSYVNGVFSSVSKKYNIMNDFMSFGLHRLWKRIFIDYATLYDHSVVLDLACGSGDITKLIAKSHPNLISQIHCVDINPEMLQIAKKELLDQGIIPHSFTNADALNLPFSDCYFNNIFISFGIRNFPDIEKSLVELNRVLKPGGQLLVLEFSKISSKTINTIYQFYAQNCIPKIGNFIANDEESYQYLVDSINNHPDQESLKAMITDANFDCEYYNLHSGLVSIHNCYKINL